VTNAPRRFIARTGALVTPIALIVATGACNRTMIPPEELASRVIMSQCPPGIPAPTPKDAPPLASLTVTLRLEPAPPAGAEAIITLGGDADKSTLRVNPAEATQLSLTKGAYLIRASLPGYTTIEGRAPLTAGCSATMTLILKKPVRP
jgi:hypothetical protein